MSPKTEAAEKRFPLIGLSRKHRLLQPEVLFNSLLGSKKKAPHSVRRVKCPVSRDSSSFVLGPLDRKQRLAPDYTQ
jgi:hypothetical protein